MREVRAGRGPMSILWGLAFIVGLPVLVAALFRVLLGGPWLGAGSYARWFLDTAPTFCLGAGLLAAVLGDLDEHTDLVSRHPTRFLRGMAFIIGALMVSVGHAFRTADEGPFDPVDGALSLPLLLIALAGAIACVVLYAPPLFYVVLIAGAPARIWLRNPTPVFLPEDSPATHRADGSSEREITLGRHPVGLTLVLSAGLIWGVGRLLG